MVYNPTPVFQCPIHLLSGRNPPGLTAQGARVEPSSPQTGFWNAEMKGLQTSVLLQPAGQGLERNSQHPTARNSHPCCPAILVEI